MRRVLFFISIFIISCSSRNIDDIKKDMELAQKNQDSSLQIKLYEEIISEFPESNDAITAEFQIAFIYNNHLNNYDEAKKRYTKFIEKFPNHELAVHAKFEIQTLGIPPEQILNVDSLSNGDIVK